MKLNKNKFGLTLISLTLMALSSSPALAWHHWGMSDGNMWSQGRAPTTEQQVSAQKIDDNYYSQTNLLRQQLMSKSYEYNALLTSNSPDSAKINALAKEIGALNQSLDEQRVKRDVAMAQAGVPRDTGMSYGYGGHNGGNYHRGRMGMGHW